MHSAPMTFRRPSARNVHQGVSNWNQHSWSVPQGVSGLLGWVSVVFFGDVLWRCSYFFLDAETFKKTIWRTASRHLVVCSDSWFHILRFCLDLCSFLFLFWLGGRRAFGAPKESPRTWIPLECSQRELFEPKKSLECHDGSLNWWITDGPWIMMDPWSYSWCIYL